MLACEWVRQRYLASRSRRRRARRSRCWARSSVNEFRPEMARAWTPQASALQRFWTRVAETAALIRLMAVMSAPLKPIQSIEESLPIRLSPTATSGSVRPCSWTFTSVAIFGSHNRSQSSSDFFPTTRPAPPTWRRLAGATGLFAPIVSRGVSANHPSRLRKPENVAERHPSRGQSPAPASLPQRIHLPFQQAVLSVQRLPFPARHRGRRHRTLPTQSFTPEPGSILHVGGVGNNRIGKDRWSRSAARYRRHHEA